MYFPMFNFLKEREKQQQQPAHFRDDFRDDRGRLDRKIIVSHLQRSRVIPGMSCVMFTS